MFIIEDEAHAEHVGGYAAIEDAVAELRRRADTPWNEAPNVALCMSWRTCGRRYELIEYDTDSTPWKQVRRAPALDISAQGVEWLLEL
ncbi:MAG: hypothetical protein P4L73_01000 [Caulobacteraceae bacterium]|nr:hypothetical protein [Caulobacteraceae bacterium]